MHTAPDQEFLALQEALAGRYSLEREIGRGGMGVVYLAREVRLDRLVALKLLPPMYAGQSALRERFLREARTAARLSHPHIVPIHAVDEAGAFVFIVMAYVEGETLEQRVRGRGPLPASEATRIIREVAWALAYAHAQGVIHRDIKPANILLEAGSGRALVTDFGIAHVSDGASLTGAAELIGTAEYMSPEQASGAAVDARSDLYALGVVGYYMLSGRVPFDGATVAVTLARQITQAAPPLSSVAPEVPALLGRAIDRCLAKDPAARFAGGEQLAEAIGLTLERRREVPLALRRFSEQVQASARSMIGLEVMAAMYWAVAAMFAFDVFGGEPPELAGLIAIVGLIFAGVPVGMLVHMARRLLRSGHSHDELLRALRTELDEQREALASGHSAQPGRLDRLLGRFVWGSLSVLVAGGIYMWFGTYFPAFETVVLPIITLAGLGFTGSALYLGVKQELRGKPRSERWLKFWDSRVGRALFKLAGVRLERPLDAGTSYRPTELAIGMAADRLFEELPTAMRKSLAELPEVVRTLELHAETVRARIAELNEILHDIEHDGALERRGALGQGDIVAKREDLADDVRAARDAAERRLAEVVAGLETIRLQLLRMHAGVGSIEGLTVDLTAAPELSRDIGHVVEGRRTVDELLGIVNNVALGHTPVPS